MTVTTAARGNRKSRHDDVRAKLADDADHVGEHLLPIPEAQRLFRRLGKPKINRPRKKLPATIKPAPGHQFLRAGDAQLLVELRADFVLSAIAAGDREIAGAIAAPAREVGDELRVLVIRMRRDVKNRAHLAKAPQVLEDGRGRWLFRAAVADQTNKHAQSSDPK